ncbi:transcription termination factor Rho [Alphaproteobacteria bacterium endosymbiont of Tiliacea citrago]|uniref:transcription termination factor Rho n=1 Tax=Alphaproteobacteria bacterium endosymbiont of Tiliacea citrago TaxID=3077944 RepID=UPI00313D86DB
MDFNELKSKKLADLLELGEQLKIEDPYSYKLHDLFTLILKRYIYNGSVVIVKGVLEIVSDAGHAFLRFPDINYKITSFDIFVPGQKVRKANIKTGDILEAVIKYPRETEKNFNLANILTINGENGDSKKNRVNFEQLTPLYPIDKINFELEDASKEDLVLRACDLVVPIGFGQRALIIAQPRTGKTILMQNMANAITKNHPEVELMVLLIDERPEEVTDMKRSVRGEVISSTFDEAASRHIQIAELTIEKAKRMVEQGSDVVLFLDSITRLARAYNTVTPSSGKVLSGGIDAHAMEGPKKIFGAARKTEEKGSLTIIGTALDKNKSQMDFYILQEFAGTGNCELYLDPNLANKRVYPAIDIIQSGTRNEDKFFKAESELNKRWAIRKIMLSMGSEGMPFLLSKLKTTKNNKELFEIINK